MRQLVAKHLPGTALHEVVDALVADLHVEWAALRSEGRPVRAAWLALRIRAYILANVLYIAMPGIAIATLRRAMLGAVALAVTAGLMLMMHRMIHRSDARPLVEREPDAWIVPALQLPPPSPESHATTRVPPDGLVRPQDPTAPPTKPPIELEPPPVEPTGRDEFPGDGLGRDDFARLPPIVHEPATTCMPLVRVEPTYPTGRRVPRDGEGSVVVRLRIDAAGSVSLATILESEPRGAFDQSVLRAVRQWRYLASPAGEAGRLHPCDGETVRLTFRRTDS
jgi:TonB family protein